jgi:hypothetical protein
MSIKIDKKKWRTAMEMLEFVSTLPIATYGVGTRFTYDGEYLMLDNPSGAYNACGWTHGIRLDRLGYALYASAVGYAPDDTSIYWMFFEPRKGDYANFQGIRHDGTAYVVESRSGGVETETDISPQDFTVDTEFKIYHATGVFRVYVNGALVVEHTTNVSSPPFEVVFGEPNGVARTVFLRYPRGVTIRW